MFIRFSKIVSVVVFLINEKEDYQRDQVEDADDEDLEKEAAFCHREETGSAGWRASAGAGATGRSTCRRALSGSADVGLRPAAG